MLKSFTRNYEDNSTDAGYQFTFFCDVCEDGFKSSFIQSTTYHKGKGLLGLAQGASILGSLLGGRASDIGDSLERGTSILTERFDGMSPEWQKEHEQALERAQSEASQHFHRCHACNSWVCDVCFNEDEGLCTNCAPRQEIYVAKARADAMRRNIDEAAETATVWKSKLESKTTICPACGKPAGAGKFCGNCGASLALKKCPACSAKVQPGLKFCGNCGQKLLSLILSGLILFSLTACTGTALGTDSKQPGTAATTVAGGKTTPGASTTGKSQGTIKVVIDPPAGWEPVTGSVLQVQYLKETSSFMVKEESQLSGKPLDAGVEKALEALGQAFKDLAREGDIETITVDGKEARKVIFTCTVGKLAMKYEYVYLIAGDRFFAITFGDIASHYDTVSADYEQILEDIRFQSQTAAAPAATTTAATKAVVATTTGKAGVPAGLVSTAYLQLLQSGRYLIRYKVTSTIDGEAIEAEVTTAVDGQSVAVITDVEDEKIHSIIKDNIVYLLDDANKTYLKMDFGANLPAADAGLFENASGLTYVGKGNGTVNGRNLPYEEYSADGETLRFFLDGKNLFAITTKSGGDEMELVVLEFTGKIPAGMLDIPAGYQESDAEPEAGDDGAENEKD